MKKILVPVDGSDNSLRAVHFVIDQMADAPAALEAHLLNVQQPVITGDVRMFVGKEAVNSYYHDEGIKALAAARAAFDAAHLPYVHHIGIGHVAETIAAYAREKGCAQIVMGARGLGSLTGLLLGSITTKVVHLADVPVTLVK